MTTKKFLQITFIIAASTTIIACSDDNKSNNSSENNGNTGIRTNDVGDYARVDRMGQPAIATALIASSNKDAYNLADPTGDESFVGDIVATVIFVANALDDDLKSAGLTPCAVDGIDVDTDINDASEISSCLNIAAGIVSPDVITIDTSIASSWPNGRRLNDPVVDTLLAAALLDVEGGTHTPASLAELPLNPGSDDAVTSANFPYVSVQ